VREEVAMRMSSRKVQYLAEKIIEQLSDKLKAKWPEGEQTAVQAIVAAIREDLEIEEEIDREAEKYIDENLRRIERENMDLYVLRKKIREELARKRGVVL
jgi:hypothetical protein